VFVRCQDLISARNNDFCCFSCVSAQIVGVESLDTPLLLPIVPLLFYMCNHFFFTFSQANSMTIFMKQNIYLIPIKQLFVFVFVVF
jgi:hypothetical protein